VKLVATSDSGEDAGRVGEQQQRNIEAAHAFYSAGPASTDEGRASMFAPDFVWPVPGDTDLSGPYSGRAYFVAMPQRMQPLDEWSIDIEHLAANADLVVAVGRVRGRRLGRVIDAPAGHVLRFDNQARLVEAWGWCADQGALDAFFAAHADEG
jgi:ketosteroid isomerase-like protein